MSIENEISSVLSNKGADIVRFVDISALSDQQNKGYSSAILIGIVLSPGYLQRVTNTPNYVEEMKRQNLIEEDEFHLMELKTDALADFTADYIQSKGYSAYSQSEKNVQETGFYDKENKSTPLPHKTIAGMAGMGWIGKHNLLITPEYGSAVSMCTVLTDAPLKSFSTSILPSLCGDCNICENVCKVNAIKGVLWQRGLNRDNIIDVHLCNTCFECAVLCPWTQKYVNRGLTTDR